MDDDRENALQAFEFALAAMDSEPVGAPDAWLWKKKTGYITAGINRPMYEPLHSAAIPLYAVPLYRHAQPAPVVPTFDEWLELRGNKPLGWVKDAMRESYDACRAATLQAEPVTTANKLGNSPVIPDGLIAAVNRLLDSDGSRGCYSAIQCGDAHDEIERLLAAAPQEVKSEP